MVKQIRLPCGLNKNGNVVYIEEVKNGLGCECICPGCKQSLIAKNSGKKREHHFAHLNIVDCEHGFQSAVHYMAKELFLEMQYFKFIKNGKPVQYKIDFVALETKIDNIIPDIIVTCDGKSFIVEIYVTHAVDDEKKLKIRNMGISAIEIDLSRFKNDLIDKEMLKTELCRIENFTWVYDADVDLIEQKRSVIQKFGRRLPFRIGNSIPCPFLASNRIKLARFVTLDFCLHCHYCVYQREQRFVTCGKLIMTPVNYETRSKLLPHVFVNDGKVMFSSEFKNYYESFFKKLEQSMQRQYYFFSNLARSMYT